MRKLTWDQIDGATNDIVKKIRESGFQPDYLVGISKGGLVLLGILAKRLDISNMITVSAESYSDKKKGELEITYLPVINLKGKSVLLVDEIADSGATLMKIAGVLRDRYKVGELKTATIVVNIERCEFVPDFWVLPKTSDWIVFPWEKLT